MKNLFKLGLVALMSVCALGFSRAEENETPEATPTFTVAVGEHATMNVDTVVFTGVANFKVKVGERPMHDSNYTIKARIFEADSFANPVAKALTEMGYAVTDTIANFEGIYNGKYGVQFVLYSKNANAKSDDGLMELADTNFYFDVTNYAKPADPAEPELAVKAVGGTMKQDTVVFANGNAAFDMFVTGLTAGDTTYRIDVTVYAGADDFPAPDMFIAKDSIRFENTYFNGVYEVNFDLKHQTPRGDYGSVKDTTIIFQVTEGEDRPEITVKAVGNTLKNDSVIFADGKVAFDVLVKGVTVKDSTYKLYVTVWNSEDDNDFPEPVVFDIADSIRFENTYFNGAYEAAFELMQLNKRGEYANVADQVVAFYVTENVANERVELAGVNVYPNPNAGTFNVAVPERARVEIFGLNGAKMMSREVNAGVETFSIDHSGIYFVRVMAGNKTAVKRVVVR